MFKVYIRTTFVTNYDRNKHFKGKSTDYCIGYVTCLRCKYSRLESIVTIIVNDYRGVNRYETKRKT